MKRKIVIGLTESEANFQYYAAWLIGERQDIEIKILSHLRGNIEDFDSCDGIVLSGGVDSHPRFYKNDRIDYPFAQEFQELRDEWEIMIFEKARMKKLPVLAICRGMQIVNIAMGGNLIQDLEEFGKNNHRRMDGKDGIHSIQVSPGSLLYNITQSSSGKINSAHHQALHDVADGLVSSATADDGTVEAIEYNFKNSNHFLIGVQWHPERMHTGDGDMKYSTNIRSAFIQAVEQNTISSNN